MDFDKLGEVIRRHSVKSRDQFQVAERLRDLLPEALQQSKRGLAPTFLGAEAERKALSDEVYLAKIDEFIQLWGEAWESRVQYETHRMLLQARQSLEAYHQVLELRLRRKSVQS